MKWRSAKFILPFILLVILCVNVICNYAGLSYFQNVNHTLIFNECNRFSENIKNEFEQSAKRLDTFSSHISYELYQLNYFHADTEEARSRNRNAVQISVDLLNEFTEDDIYLLVEDFETDTFEDYSRVLPKEQLAVVKEACCSIDQNNTRENLANYRIIDMGTEFLLIRMKVFYEYDYSSLLNKEYGFIIAVMRLEKLQLREKLNLPQSMKLFIYGKQSDARDLEFIQSEKNTAAMSVSNVIETNNENYTLECVLQSGQDISGFTDVYLMTWLQLGVNALLTGVCVYIVIRYIANPLDMIVKRMAIVALDAKERMPNDFMCNEISILAARFNSLLDTLEIKNKTIIDTQKHLYEMELCNKESEMRALRSQLNPHFIYNMLENIRVLSEMNRNDDITLVTVEISKFLRYSLYVNGFVTIADELKVLESYLEIMKICYGSEFQVEYVIDEELKAVQIPKMIIQPMVENIFKHGFVFEQNSNNMIHIEVTRIKDGVKICVEDNGYGVAREKLDKLNRELSLNEVGTQGHGFGLYSINRRIKTIYGTEYGVSIESTERVYTRVTVTFPIWPEKGE